MKRKKGIGRTVSVTSAMKKGESSSGRAGATSKRKSSKGKFLLILLVVAVLALGAPRGGDQKSGTDGANSSHTSEQQSVQAASNENSGQNTAQNKTSGEWKADLGFGVECSEWRDELGVVVVSVDFPNGANKQYSVKPGNTYQIYDCEEGDYSFSARVENSDGYTLSYSADPVVKHFSKDNASEVKIALSLRDVARVDSGPDVNSGNGEGSGGGSSGGAAAGVQPSNPVSASYVLNSNTMKFHRLGCGDAARIKEYNRIDYTGTRESVIGMGYVPCKKCNP